MFNEQNEIRGDEMDDVRAELERIDGYEACPVAPESDEDVNAHHDDWQARMGIEDPEPMGSLDSSDDAEALASAGMGTDEDYGYFGGEDAFLDGSYEE